MGFYEIVIFDQHWYCISKDFKRFDDRQQAELKAEADCDWLGGSHWDVRKIR